MAQRPTPEQGSSPEGGEVITDRPGRRLVIVRSDAEMTLTWTRHAPGQPGTKPHVHHEHTDAFFVVEGELTLPVGPGEERIVAAAGTYVAVPPGVIHSFVNASDAPAAWLNLHTPDAGFAAYLRGSDAPWDDHEPPGDGGRPVADVVVVVTHGS